MKVYLSRIKHLRIVIKPGTSIYEGGVRVGDKPGEYATFVEGKFETEDKAVIKKLESLPTFGFDFYAEEKNKNDDQGNGNDGDELESKTKKELLAIAEEKGLEVDGSSTKEEIINLLKS